MKEYRFGPFRLSLAERRLWRGAEDVPLIPRYFDLLVLLVERRRTAVHRQQIFDVVWSDVIVSDGALTQAIRTLRRALGDEARDPQFIRTVSRHGYQFVGEVEELSDSRPASPDAAVSPVAGTAGADPPAADNGAMDLLVARLLDTGHRWSDDERRAAAAELLARGLDRVVERLQGPGSWEARALLRDARWDVARAETVPLFGTPGALSAARALVRLRARQWRRAAAARWRAATLGGGLAGAFAGTVGAALLYLLPGATAGSSVFLSLALIGALVGFAGAAIVGAALCVVEVELRSARGPGLVLAGALAGGAAGFAGNGVARMLVADLFGKSIRLLGGVEGAVIGLGVGLGYAIATRGLSGGGLAAPHGWQRVRVVAVCGLVTATAAGLLGAFGGRLVGASLDALADVFDRSSVGLGVLARQLGEGQLRPFSISLVSAFEGLSFGAGVAAGITTRPAADEDAP